MNEKISKLAEILIDYRAAENLNPKEENINQWISQFSTENQEIILDEMIHICSKMYLSEQYIDAFLIELVRNKELTNNNPTKFWNNISLLNIQKDGNSQKFIIEKFKDIISNELGIEVAINDNTKLHYIYLDDFLFTGNRLYQDIKKTLLNSRNMKVDIIYIGYFKYGKWYHSKQLKNNFSNIKFKFWRRIELENGLNCHNQSYILWNTKDILKENSVIEFLKNYSNLNQIIYRDKTQFKYSYCESDSLFSSEKHREILEKEFTLAGIKIINRGKQKGWDMRSWKPLGFSPFNNLGFGAMVFSYRNCPNNTPLCLWWGDWNNSEIWYPLFQRKGYNR